MLTYKDYALGEDGDAEKAAKAAAKVLGIPADSALKMLKAGFSSVMSQGVGLTKEEKAELGDSVEAEVASRLAARLDAIVAGTLPSRSGPRGKRGLTVEGMVKKLAKSEIEEIASAQGKSLPKGKDFTALRDSYIAQNEERLVAEAEAAITRAQELAANVNLDLAA